MNVAKCLRSPFFTEQLEIASVDLMLLNNRLTFVCSKPTRETLEKGAKFFQNYQ